MSEEYTDLTPLIEQLPGFEERLGIRIEAIYATIRREEYEDEYSVTVTGEVHAASGMELDTDIQLVLSVLDSSGRVTGKSDETIYSDDFYGLHVFEFYHQTRNSDISRLRVHPKKW